MAFPLPASEIYFRNYELAKFSINIIYDNGENEKKEYSSDKFIFIKQDKLIKYYKRNELCKIILEVELLDNIQTKKPMIEISVLQIENTPYYFTKGVLKNFFINGNKNLYLYTNIEKGEDGYVTINIDKRNFIVLGDIINISKKEIEIDSFPQDESELYFDYNFKQLFLDKEKTNDCNFEFSHCYLLITIKFEDFINFTDNEQIIPFSIFANIIHKENIPIKIEIEDIIIGSN